MNTERTIRLSEKLKVKQNAIIKTAERQEKLKSEVAALKEEIRRVSRDELGDFLEKNGVSFEEVREAVKNGLFRKEEQTENTSENGVTYNTVDELVEKVEETESKESVENEET